MPELNEYTQPASSARSWLTPVMLVAANTVPLIGVLAWGWDVAHVVLFYWSENLLIGVANLIRLLSFLTGHSTFLALFFTLHYGGFCAAHGFLLISLFDLEPTVTVAPAATAFSAIPLLGLLGEAVMTVQALAPPLWLWGFAALALSHLGSLLVNWFLRDERSRTSPNELMTAPYQRIMILHVTVLLGGLGVEALGSPILLLMLLIALKTAVDLRAHLSERNQLA